MITYKFVNKKITLNNMFCFSTLMKFELVFLKEKNLN